MRGASLIRARPLGLALVVLGAFASLYLVAYYQSPTFHSQEWRSQRRVPFGPKRIQETLVEDEQDLSAGNATLGFQALLALSQGTKWRVDGLMAAAQASNITLQIPAQPKWSQEFIESFEHFGPVDAHGAAMAWLGHIDLLKFVIQNRWGSALIMEDDVDWDVRIRKQTQGIARGVRELTRKKGWREMLDGKGGEVAVGDSPYGDAWDVLWMGHCSDPPDMLKPVISWKDDTVIPWNQYTGIDRYMTSVLTEGERSVHRSFNPVCTFAYAISARGARKVLKIASTGKGGAFDLMLNYNCKQGSLDCISVNPEIFDSYHPAGGDASEVRAGDAGTSDDDHVAVDMGKEMGHSDNIPMSARCQGIWGSTCLTDFKVED